MREKCLNLKLYLAVYSVFDGLNTAWYNSYEKVKVCKDSKKAKSENPIIQMIGKNRRIVKAIKNGESLSTLIDIKIVSPI